MLLTPFGVKMARGQIPRVGEPAHGTVVSIGLGAGSGRRTLTEIRTGGVPQVKAQIIGVHRSGIRTGGVPQVRATLLKVTLLAAHSAEVQLETAATRLFGAKKE